MQYNFKNFNTAFFTFIVTFIKKIVFYGNVNLFFKGRNVQIRPKPFLNILGSRQASHRAKTGKIV